MASTKEYRDYILEQTSALELTYKQMMGEWLLYCNGVYFGGICDDRLLVKKTKSVEKYNFCEQTPYDGAKPMLLVDNVDNRELLCRVIIDICNDLSTKKK